MSRRLSSRRSAVVTGGAGAGSDSGVIHRRGNPGRGPVTGVAGLRGGDVCCSLTPGLCTVVAGRASAWRHAGVAECGRDPCCSPVTSIASLGRRDVGGRLAPGGAAVMAGRTSSRNDSGVTESCRSPSGGAVTGIAGGCRGNVRRRLPCCLAAVMAGGASPRHHARVIVACRYKNPIGRTHPVTRITGGRRYHMGSWLPASLHPVVTVQAGARCDALMFEGRSCPAHGPVATVARHGCRNMGGRLALCGSLVVTSGARSGSHPVMCKERGLPTCSPVASITIGRRG